MVCLNKLARVILISGLILGATATTWHFLSERSSRKILWENSLARVQLKPFGTPAELAFRYNIPYEELINASPELSRRKRPSKETTISFPAVLLNKTLEAVQIQQLPKSQAHFDEKSSTLWIEGQRTHFTLEDIQALSNEKIIKKDNGGWTLYSNIRVTSGATLLLNSKKKQTLRLASDQRQVVHIAVEDGRALIHDISITSWDEVKKGPDENTEDGRAFIYAKNNSRMDIVNAEISFLGSSKEVVGASSRGVSWRIGQNRLGVYLVTGNVLNSTFHNNYYAIYTFGATGMQIARSIFVKNDVYGIDPHDDSTNLRIENNMAFRNGRHGIIISARCNFNTIRNNISFSNGGHGIMIDRQSDYNLVENNIVALNTDGVIVSDSSDNNVVQKNIAIANGNGITIRMLSEANTVLQNTIFRNEKGINLSSDRNDIQRNTLKMNVLALSIKSAAGNKILQNILHQNEKLLYFEAAEKNIMQNDLLITTDTQ